MEILFKRRSVRKYQPRPVEIEKLKKIAEAAMYAPSAGDQQPWQFIIITERGILDQLGESGPYSGPVGEAPAAIVVIGDMERETRKGFWVQDCAAAMQNLLLEATFLGLGSVWIGIYPREERMANVSRILRLPVYAIPFSIAAIGYPAEEKEKPGRWDDSRVHENYW